MAIKVGFNTSTCPDWDIATVAAKADELGFYGVELGSVRNGSNAALPLSDEMRSDPEGVRKLFDDKGVELVSVAVRGTLDSNWRREIEEAQRRITETIELAAAFGCSFVRVPIGRPEGVGSFNGMLSRAIGPFSELAHVAGEHDVTLLVTNTAELPSSRSIWFVTDGVSHPCLQAAWDPMLGLSARESNTVAIPRLGIRTKMVIASDAVFEEDGRFRNLCPVGQGNVDFAHAIDLLKGVMFNGYLMLDWPEAYAKNVGDPQSELAAALELLRSRIKHSDPELSAYKKDKNAPNYATAGTAYVERKGNGTPQPAEEPANEAASS